MAISSAEKQRRYRQRKALERAGNAYPVTLLRGECERVGREDVLNELWDCARMVYDAGGNGSLFLERASVLFYGYFSGVSTPEMVTSRAGQAPDIVTTSSQGK